MTHDREEGKKGNNVDSVEQPIVAELRNEVEDLKHDLNEYIRISSELATENESLRKDKERLDWLDKENGAINSEGYGEYTYHFEPSDTKHCCFGTAREVIDEVMNPSAKAD